MILCNLAILLAERHLKITKVSQDTGISRTTLTALANNYGKGLQFDTIDTLCLYLKTTPAQLISFAPVTIDCIKVAVDSGDLSLEITMDVEMSGKKRSCIIIGDAFASYDKVVIDNLQIELGFIDEEANPDPDTKENNIILEKAFGMLSRIFIEDIAKTISQKIIESIDAISPVYVDGEYYKDYILSDGYSLSFSWPFDDWGKN